VIIKELNGHSGCRLFLCEEDNRKYVRKISSSSDYNDRLKKQMSKQESFSDPVLKTPRIYKSGHTSGLFFFDMEFVGGTSFHNFITLNTIDNIVPLIERILFFLRNSPITYRDITADIESKISKIQNLTSFAISKYCNYCLDYDWSEIPLCESHGDLTFENILIYESEMYLIDFLDSFVETKYVDYGKLFQDILLMWSWRNNNNFPFIKNIYLYDRITQEFTHREMEIVKRFLVLGLLRIIPYSDENVLNFLENRLQYISEKFGI
jgi:predicted Ser/Thr protein kinase